MGPGPPATQTSWVPGQVQAEASALQHVLPALGSRLQWQQEWNLPSCKAKVRCHSLDPEKGDKPLSLPWTLWSQLRKTPFLGSTEPNPYKPALPGLLLQAVSLSLAGGVASQPHPWPSPSPEGTRVGDFIAPNSLDSLVLNSAVQCVGVLGFPCHPSTWSH